MKRIGLLFVLYSGMAIAQKRVSVPEWSADLGNGYYRNPVLHADYSDPDAVRVGNDYYLTASSFEDVPGLPILHSTDLVNWTLIGHALKRLPPYDHFAVPRHGEGVWAPSIRYHNGEFYIYYPDPDFGIYLVKAKDPAGPWSEPVLVESGKGLIDPCPLWEANGDAHLVHAYAGSRAGIKSVLVVKKLSADGTRTLDAGVLIYDGHQRDPTIEGPKLYKRNGWYYVFAPAGGVSTGWQVVLRSRTLYGPYERRVVMDQGATSINGPHQGAWVTTAGGEDWFLHFQDKEAYGRVLHLQPLQWKADWPVIGDDPDGDGKGQPVLEYRKPQTKLAVIKTAPPATDEFSDPAIGPQWQWMANPKATWAFPDPAKGCLRLFSDNSYEQAPLLWNYGNVLQQKFPAEHFTVTTKLRFFPNAKLEGERTGLAILGQAYAGLVLQKDSAGLSLQYLQSGNKTEKLTRITDWPDAPLWLKVMIEAGGHCQFYYSADGTSFLPAGEPFTAVPGRWKGAKFGIFCTRTGTTNDSGYAEFDFVSVVPGIN